MKALKPEVEVITQSCPLFVPIAEDLKQVLEEKDLLNDGQAKNKFFVTDAPERVFEIADNFLGKKVIPSLEKVEL